MYLNNECNYILLTMILAFHPGIKYIVDIKKPVPNLGFLLKLCHAVSDYSCCVKIKMELLG